MADHHVDRPLGAAGATPARRVARWWRLAALTLCLLGGLASAQRTEPTDTTDTGGPVRLRQPAEATEPAASPPRPGTAPARTTEPTGRATTPPERQPLSPDAQMTPGRPAGLYVPGEFERYVQKLVGPTPRIRRLGAELVTGAEDGLPHELSPLVPDDYLLATGDEVLLTLWGSVDADLRLMVDRAGRITIPRVGTVQVAGVRMADLRDVVARRVAQVFRNFELSVSLGHLRGIRVFVTGNVLRPGAHTVGSLSTAVAALMRAGGPSAAGTFRQIEIRRGAILLGQFDLYALLERGDRGGDRILQAGDVVHVGPVGTQVAVIGSVNRPAVIELRSGETLADALRYVGGFSAVADRRRLALERLEDRNSGRVAQVDWPTEQGLALATGDVLRAFSAVDSILPTQQQSKRVRIEGEVARPGDYVLPASSSIADAIRAAGGLTASAFVYGTEFERESVRLSQQENYDRALRDLETDALRTTSTQRVTGAEEAASRQATLSAQGRLLDRLRALRPTGRIVLQLPPDARDLPDLALEDGDRIYIPSRPTTIGVFGSVFNAATYLHLPGRTLEDYLRLAGGPTKGADPGSTFVVRANGNVVSNRQGSGMFRRGTVVEQTPAEPGDTVFVPEELDKTTFTQMAKDWTQILYQFGIGVAGIKALSN
jgi:protein involved in polysaccharide export with SLBB domain